LATVVLSVLLENINRRVELSVVILKYLDMRRLQSVYGDPEDYMKNVEIPPSVLAFFEKFVYKHRRPGRGDKTEYDFSEDLLKWAMMAGVEHMTFVCYPYNNASCEKQDSLIDIKYSYDKVDKVVKGESRILLSNELLLKTEADGSSFPSGGLRATHTARAYTVRDPHSEIFIRFKNKLMYVPSLLVSHYGEALDDKGIFRKAEKVMKDTAFALLEKLGKKPKEIVLNLGLEQEFFVVPRRAYYSRPDLMFCGRALLGSVGAKNQQFSDHYYAKLPAEIEKIFWEVEKEFLEVGIALKTKHNEVALNQFEYAAVYCDAGKAIDQNLIAMQILKEAFNKGEYQVLFHEKPFLELNGSGKHANWSLGYVDKDGKVKNLFSPPSSEDEKKYEEEKQLFRLFILITLAALKNHSALFFSSVAPPGNEIRLGGHEAPPRIISAYLGRTVGDIIDGKVPAPPENLKKYMPFLLQDVYQEDTDRNRTSSFPYAGHRFEFRALGSSQNAAWPMAVISATLASEMKKVIAQLEQGVAVEDIISKLRDETEPVRFDGDGYSHEWATEAKKRGLYVNESWPEVLEMMHKEVQVFVDVGACSNNEIQAKVEVEKERYIKTVDTEVKALLRLSHQKIIPRAMRHLETLAVGSKSTLPFIKSYTENFETIFNKSLESLNKLKSEFKGVNNCTEASKIRGDLAVVGAQLGRLTRMLEKDSSFPDLEDFLVK
jgi:glutamine synthetase